ncbi:alcohol dehydrogenase catalytic domain-containing protein [Actinomadura vinacea]|uniref:Alcohol dehydrogenase catalytic domain-containing protein n=2 Tax=Actinomadura vinacea TaxID=115336 RepID=A0ABN3K6I0_9ACTN
MRAVSWAGPGRLAHEVVPIPRIVDGEVLVQVAHAGICGSDLAILKGEHARARPGVRLGHEFAGTVAASSAEGAPAVGTRVAVRPLIACADRAAVPPGRAYTPPPPGESCRACVSGNPHVCRSLGLYGVDEPGGLAEYVAVRADAVHPLRPEVAPELAALAEPLAVAVHAVSRSGLTGGENVAVFGGGPIGLLTALVARRRGAGSVVIVEPNAWRRGVAERFGFPVLEADADVPARIRAGTSGDGADIVFDSAGHPAVARQMTEAARIQGTIVIVGVHKTPPAVDLRTVNFAEHRLVGARVYARADFAAAVDLIEDDALGLAELPLRTFPLDEVDGAFSAAAAGEGSVKVLIAPIPEGAE